jgi:DNA-directed RNA polymerase beta' subunit
MEMNLHMPQDPESEAELKHLAAVEYQIISPGNNASIIGIFQDSMLGCYQFTRENINFTPREAMNLLMMSKRVNETELLSKGGELISSFDILSQIMPPLSLKYKTKSFNEENDNIKTSNTVLEIKNGKYIRGQMDKSVLGGNSKGLLQRICNDFGNIASSNFIDDLQNIITEYLKSTAFSVGISDLISNEKTNQSITQIITTKKVDVQNLIDQIQIGIFDNNTGKTNQTEFETRVNNILNQATSETGKIGLKSLNKNNRFVTMVNAGSKGSDLNISFMISCLGQQNVDGKRIPYGFEHRTLPHFNKFDDSPGARGFVESSYINGLSPQELFFHAMGGRLGLIDTAIKTASTGYISRRLIKGLEDLMVNYDMTIRTNKNKIVQFSYGDDGIDPTKVENQLLPIVGMSIQDIYAHYNIPDETNKTKVLNQIFLKNVVKRHSKQITAFNLKAQVDTEFMCRQRDEIIKNVFKNKGDNIVNCPVAFSYIINNIQGQCNITSSSLVDITLYEAYQIIDAFYATLEKIHYAPPTMLFKILYHYYLSPKELLIIKRFNKHALTLLLETIGITYKRAIVAPGEMVGIIAGQSIGEISTQLTLNSVTYETEIIVRTADGYIKKVQIGEFIEKKILIAKKIEYYKDKDTTYAELEDYYEIPSCDEDGNILWKRIEAVTRHPVINKDDTNTMLKITTNEQREVIATKAKSFLKLVNGKIIPVNGDELKVGDYLPVSKKQIDFNEQRQLELRTILPPTEYIYSSEVEKAKEVMHEYHWWSKHHNKTFTLPYKRSDSFVAKVNDKLRENCKTKTTFIPNCVYTLQTNMNNYTIPEVIEMDYNFGYLIGAYASEGCMTKFQLSIANNDAEYFKPILELCKKWNITTKIYKHENKNQEGWSSQDLRIYNTLLCRILEKFCGKLSHNKFVSDKIVFSNRECLLGFIDAYIGGDGSVNVKTNTVSMASVSKQLLIDVQQILNILGIYSYIQKYKKQEKNNRGTLPENIHQMYSLAITGSQINRLTEMLNIKLAYKQKHLIDTLDHTYKYEIHKNDTIIPNEIDGEIVFEERNNNYTGVLFDKIKSIEEVPNTTNYAYDLTISDTRTFNIYNGLAIFDTFHFAGVSTKSNVTTGVPRIEEILNLTSEPKNPSLNVYLKPEDETDKDKAHSITYMLEHTKLKELVKTIEICFDPNDYNTLIEEDHFTIVQFKAFEEMMDECNGSTKTGETDKSKWIIRMVMDAENMLEKNITMDDINFTLHNCYENQLNCIYSDYNSEKLIFRIRMNEVLKSSSSKARAGEKIKTKVKPLDQSDHIYMLKNFQDQLLQNVVIRGISGIKKVVLRKIKDNVVEKNGSYKKQDIWVLDTIGTNLLEVLSLDFIDKNRTVSNNIMEVYDVLGIEAARQTIYNEFVEVIEFDGTYINYHNFSILCDRMTFTSKLISICRHGINNDDIGPIAKASFEETPEMFLKAARHSELDTMRGVSANIMCGQEGFFGTSCFQVILDIAKMQELSEESTKYNVEENEEDLIHKFFETTNPDDPCSISKLTIQNNVVSIKQTKMGNDENDYNPEF